MCFPLDLHLLDKNSALLYFILFFYMDALQMQMLLAGGDCSLEPWMLARALRGIWQSE